MSEHSELVAEIAQVEKMSTPDRLKHAKKRRAQQLKRFANYEKQLEKDKSKKNKQSINNQRRQNKKRARVRFIHNIMLLESAARNDLEEVRKLLMSGVSPDVTNEDGLTALHQCCIDDSEEMLRLLLEFGANVNARDSEMWTPLHAAATCGHVHLCKLLIDKGAELLAVNADGNMPYDICEDEVALDYIESEMAKRGITQEEIDEKRLETEKKMLEDLKLRAKEGKSLETKDKNRATPLHVACANGYSEVVEFLLDHHVSMEVRDEDGWLPIHAAACWLQPEVIEILVKNGAYIDAKTRTGETPFDLAEDPDVKQKILDLKDEMENHRSSRNKEHPRNRRVNTRGYNSSSGSMYSSNSSLNEKPTGSSHAHSASIRRTSMRGEKKPLFKKEAKEEALHFGMMGMNNDDDDAMDYREEKENVPATNIDDVTITLIDDVADTYHPEVIDNNKHSLKDTRSVNNKHKDAQKESSHKAQDKEQQQQKQQQGRSEVKEVKEVKVPTTVAHKPQAPKGQTPETQKSRPSESESRKAEPPPIHIQMVRTGDSNPVPVSQSAERSPVIEKDKRSSSEVKPTSPPSSTNNPPNKPSGRVPSFRKNRDSQRRANQDEPPNNPVRYPTGTPSGTLADLKKQRAEQHKFGNSLDAQVQNLFLHSLSGDNSKYRSGGSTGSAGTSPQQAQPPRKDSAQNGRNVKNNNNNNNNSPRQAQPPGYISDNGQLRRFSAPTSSPVIGEDNKFKSNCCVIL